MKIRNEIDFAQALQYFGAKSFEREYRFHTTRRWRFDFAWPKDKIAVEIEGLVYTGRGRHQMTQGYENDCEKYNTATIQGWRVFRFTYNQIKKGEAFEVLEFLGIIPRLM